MRTLLLIAILALAPPVTAEDVPPSADEIATNAEALIGSDLNLAIVFARKAVKADRASARATLVLAEAYRRRGWLDDAQLEVERLLARAPQDPDALLLRAHIVLDQKRPAEALEAAGRVDRATLGAPAATKLDRLLEDVKAAPPAPASRPVVVYTAPWCGYCRRLMAWLGERKVVFVARDIEREPGADDELSRKCRTYGVRRGPIPVTDVDGELVVGFDREKLARLLR